MSKKATFKGKGDPRYLSRDELERELVGRDKQALISDCLKIFDMNTMLFEQLEVSKQTGTMLSVEVARLNSRTLWAILNERIAIRIEQRRKKRGSREN
jgi:hypothetical protein